MCRKNLKQPFKFFCYTEDPTDIRPEVNIIPFVDHGLEIIVHNKLFLFSEYVDSFLTDDNRMYLDLDLIIKHPIDHIADNNVGELTTIRSSWREERERGTLLCYHMINSSCMTWKRGYTTKIWEHFIRDPEHYTLKYFFGMDSFLSYEADAMGINLHVFPERIFMSWIHGGIDFHEQRYFSEKYHVNFHRKCPEVLDKVCIILLNGTDTHKHYEGFEKYYTD
jgi:hypothetical protein